MSNKEIFFSKHAIQRMFERNISTADIRSVIENAEVIAKYDEDKPYPSRLLLGFINQKPLHIVVATDTENNIEHIITVYTPNTILWTHDFKRRLSQ